jgi:hypothetical protein
MKFLPAITFLGLLALLPVSGQAQNAGVKTPQVILNVTRHRLGADVFSVGVVRANYPDQVLRAQINSFGQYLGSAPRGLNLVREGAESGGQLRASFAVDGFVDSATGIVRLDALAKAFAPSAGGAFEVALIINGFVPSAQTIRSYSSAGVDISTAQYRDGLEYRIAIKASDPDQIRIPLGTEPIAEPKPSGNKSSSPDWGFWALLGVAGIAVGALVYSLLLRPTSLKRR